MIGVAGPTAAATSLAAAIDDEDVRVGAAPRLVEAAPELIVALGEEALSALVRAGVEAPVLPVGTGPGLPSVEAEAAPALVDEFTAAGGRTRAVPVLAVAIDEEPVGRGLFDAMVVTREPARISEYAVETASGTDRYRADGVVVATPAGSHGYGRAVGGPVLDAGAGSLAVVPVAAFAIRAAPRVTGADASLTVSVERDEGDISLLVDGTDRGTVPTRRPVRVAVDGALDLVVAPDA